MEPKNDRVAIILPFLFFFLSGFCGLLYQMVWVRLAYASFGIIAPVMSVVISVFMLGLALGSWIGGRAVRPLCRRAGLSPLVLYAATEFIIGTGAVAVPRLFGIGEKLLYPLGAMNSLPYLLLTGALMAATLLPWCFCMGATIPLIMAFLEDRGGKTTGFSLLYLANVTGALAGIFVTVVFLVEVLGFRGTLRVAMLVNFFIAGAALAYSRFARDAASIDETQAPPSSKPPEFSHGVTDSSAYFILFLTGFISMTCEVLWVRAFTPVLGTEVYSFASIVFFYMVATTIGSLFYRRDLAAGHVAETGTLLAIAAVCACLPTPLADPRLALGKTAVFIGIIPLCGLLGYLTPRLIEVLGRGDPRRTGWAYAVNVVGCILGPLAASYLILPYMGTRHAMALLAAPLVLLTALFPSSSAWTFSRKAAAALVGISLILCGLLVSTSYEEGATFGDRVVRRDYSATVISAGKGYQKRLYVNGQGITVLHRITKVMAHLPLALHETPPESVLVICFGMGTTFRSAMSWGVRTTAIDLTPSVFDAFGYYFRDADALAKNPRARLVADDGRRFLERTRERYDIITIDPPPPIESAGSSLLYSADFYAILKKNLKPGGILQQWYPGGADKNLSAILRSVMDSFPHVTVFCSFVGVGYHIIASEAPVEIPGSDTLVARMPETAKADMREWLKGADEDLTQFFDTVLQGRRDLGEFLDPDPRVLINDDRPFNEYYILRKELGVRR